MKKLQLGMLLSFLCLSFSLQAQTKEQLHPQNAESSNYVHGRGTGENPSKSFVDQYAPPQTISSYGGEVEWLFRYTSWVTFAFFCILCFLLLYFGIRYRARNGHKAFYTHGKFSNEKAVTMGMDILFFIVLDCVLIWKTFSHTTDFIWKTPEGPQVVKVMIMPQQWAWNFRYAGLDGEFNTADDITTLNQLYIPKDRPIVTQIMSKDVIHGFYIPEVRLQIDAIPGSVTRFWFDSNVTGDFEIACIHLCGTSHYKMKAFLKVLENDDFEAWYSENSEWAQAKFDPNDTLTHWGWNWGI